MSKGTTEIGYLCHHGHYCFYADPDEGGQCGTKRVGTVTLSFDDTDAPSDWTEIVADAQSSLAEKYETWRNCDCKGSAAYVKEADDLLVSIEKRADAAEALLDSLAADVIKDARIRGDAAMRSIAIAAAHIRNRVEDYKIHRDAGHMAADCPLDSQPNTKEQNVAFRKAWDARYEAGQKRGADS